jgi:hypothetical protein
MMSIIYVYTEDRRWLIGNIDRNINKIIAGVNSRNIDLDGINALDMYGSNEEKMSGIMQNSGGA